MKWSVITWMMISFSLHSMEQASSSSSSQPNFLTLAATLESVNRNRTLFLHYAEYTRANNKKFILSQASIQHDNHDTRDHYHTLNYQPGLAHRMRHPSHWQTKRSDVSRAAINSLMDNVDPRDSRYTLLTKLVDVDAERKRITIRCSLYKTFQKSKIVICKDQNITIEHDTPQSFAITEPYDLSRNSSSIIPNSYNMIFTATLSTKK